MNAMAYAFGVNHLCQPEQILPLEVPLVSPVELAESEVQHRHVALGEARLPYQPLRVRGRQACLRLAPPTTHTACTVLPQPFKIAKLLRNYCETYLIPRSF